GGLLARGGDVEPDASLALKGEASLVGRSGKHHDPVRLEEFLPPESGRARGPRRRGRADRLSPRHESTDGGPRYNARDGAARRTLLRGVRAARVLVQFGSGPSAGDATHRRAGGPFPLPFQVGTHVEGSVPTSHLSAEVHIPAPD